MQRYQICTWDSPIILRLIAEFLCKIDIGASRNIVLRVLELPRPPLTTRVCQKDGSSASMLPLIEATDQATSHHICQCSTPGSSFCSLFPFLTMCTAVCTSLESSSSVDIPYRCGILWGSQGFKCSGRLDGGTGGKTL